MYIYLFVLLIVLYLVFMNQLIFAVANKSRATNENEMIFKNKIFLMICFVILVLFSTFRNKNVGTDTPMYYNFFYNGGFNGLLEIGFVKIYDISIALGDFRYWLLITSLITISLILYGIKNHTSNYILAIFFFIVTHCYYYTFNGVRQAVVAAIFFAFLHLLVEKNFKKILAFIFLIGVSLLFHNSAIFLLLLFFIPTKKVFSMITTVILFLVTIVFYFSDSIKMEIFKLISKYSFTYVEKYAEKIEFFQVNKQKGIIEVLPIVFQMAIVVVAIYILKKESVNNKFLILSTNCYILFLGLYSFAGIEAADRFQIYFTYFNIYFLANFSMFLIKKKGIYLIFFYVIVVFFVMYYILRLLRNTHGILLY